MNDDKTTKFWADHHIHPSLAAAAYLDESPDWKVGDPAVIVLTRSGASYEVEPDGTLSGGSREVNGARLVGAVPSGSTLLRVKCVIVGLRMEFVWNKKRYASSTVESVEKRENDKT